VAAIKELMNGIKLAYGDNENTIKQFFDSAFNVLP
jgi:hypothetical protein